MELSEKVGKQIKDISINPEVWANGVVLLSNSELDGFREGDADLMDKVLLNLRSMNVKAHRIVANAIDAPEDRKKEVASGQLMPLSFTRNPTYDELQKNFLL